jgi:predicted transcriptional regulator
MMYGCVYDPGMSWTNMIRKAVRDSGLTRFDVAKKAGVFYPRVWFLMDGKSVTLDIAEKISKAVGLELVKRKAKKR